MDHPGIAWYVYATAYAYSLFVGQLVGLVTNHLYKIADPQEKGLYPHTWQAPVIGIVERALYLSSLLAGHGEFVGLWVALKIGVQYKRWTELDLGRTLFMNNLIGNALSVLYAGTGFGIIVWMKSNLVGYAIGVPIALVLGTLSLRLWLWLRVKPEGTRKAREVHPKA
jgi:hypothetical protein